LKKEKDSEFSESLLFIFGVDDREQNASPISCREFFWRVPAELVLLCNFYVADGNASHHKKKS